MENKNTNFTGVIASVILLIVFMTASFAYFGMFTVNLENKVAVNIHASTIGDTSFIATSANLNVIVPTSGMFKGNTGLAAENTATLTVNLTGAQDVITTCTYDVVYEYDLSSEIYGSTVAVTSGATKEITMQVDSPSGTNSFASETNFAYDSSWSAKTSTVGAKKTLVKNATITSEGTSVVQNINITGRYYNLEVDQAQLGNKSFTGKIYVENNNCTVGEIPKAKDTILAKNGGKEAIEVKGKPTFTTSATTNEGMYAIEDNYGTSYYFRGAVDNNWVKFGKYSQDFIKYIGYYSTTSSAYKTYDTLEECNSSTSYNKNCTKFTYGLAEDDIYWRIIRINGDGSIRMIYTGTTTPTESTKVVMTGEGTQISISPFNSSIDKSEYVGYKYEIGKQHGLSNDSTIKTTLENWYKTTTLYTDEATSKLVVDTPFCYDRSASTSETGTYGEISDWLSTPSTDYNYGSFGRLKGNQTGPSLKCPNELDKYSVANGTLSYPVGLITADEIALAGGRNAGNRSYYLYTGQYYWSGSPSYFSGNTGEFIVFFVHPSGRLNGDDVYYYAGVRGSVSLSSNVQLSGDGTWNNPYIVKN